MLWVPQVYFRTILTAFYSKHCDLHRGLALSQDARKPRSEADLMFLRNDGIFPCKKSVDLFFTVSYHFPVRLNLIKWHLLASFTSLTHCSISLLHELNLMLFLCTYLLIPESVVGRIQIAVPSRKISY